MHSRLCIKVFAKAIGFLSQLVLEESLLKDLNILGQQIFNISKSLKLFIYPLPLYTSPSPHRLLGEKPRRPFGVLDLKLHRFSEGL